MFSQEMAVLRQWFNQRMAAFVASTEYLVQTANGWVQRVNTMCWFNVLITL